MVIKISGKSLHIKNITGPLGVRGRNSDNNLIGEKLHWKPNYPLENGIKITYDWINIQLNKTKST
jgi:nucleoside-diphosphate-sugar epimerase